MDLNLEKNPINFPSLCMYKTLRCSYSDTIQWWQRFKFSANAFRPCRLVYIFTDLRVLKTKHSQNENANRTFFAQNFSTGIHIIQWVTTPRIQIHDRCLLFRSREISSRLVVSTVSRFKQPMTTKNCSVRSLSAKFGSRYPGTYREADAEKAKWDRESAR